MGKLPKDLRKGARKEKLKSLRESVDKKLVLDDKESPNSWSLVGSLKPGQKYVLSMKQLEACESWVQELFLKSSPILGNSWIPKHLVSLDVKYFRRCLEAIHISASTTCPSGPYFNLNSLDRGLVTESLAASEISKGSLVDLPQFVIEHPMEVGGGNVTLSPVGRWVVGSITKSSGMMSILNNPLFQRSGMLESNSKLGITDLGDNKRFIRPKLTGSSELSFTSLQKIEDTSSLGYHHGYRPYSIQQSPVSISSMASALSTDQASCSWSYPSNCQAMLHWSWRGGLLHFEFSVDDQKDLYVANPIKVELLNDKSVDYVYSFYLKGSEQYDASYGYESVLLGKMKVLTSISLCPSNFKVMETEFVLFSLSENHESEMQLSSLRGKKHHRKLSRVVDLFKISQTFKQRSNSRFGGSGVIFESHPECSQQTIGSTAPPERTDLLQSHFPPNLELATIVVKEHVQDDNLHKEDVGGWGLKFLKKARAKQYPSPLPLQVTEASSCCSRNSGVCSTSINVLLPVSVHGVPTSGSGQPSSILNRWKSGGHCDCGGWDVGCPLTVLKGFPRKEDGSPDSNILKDCKSFDVITEGSNGGMPILKMTNVHDGLYLINFRSTVSILQCFSVAVALIHSQTPSLQPKHVKV